MTRAWLWFQWRCLDVSAYLAWQTDDSNLAQDLECQARQAKNRLDDHVLNEHFKDIPL